MFLSERPPLRPYRLAEVCRCQLECREASSGRTSDTPLCELWGEMECQGVNIERRRPDIVRHGSP